MCNLYSITTNQAAIIALFRVINRYVGNLPPMTGVFPTPKAHNRRRDDGLHNLLLFPHGLRLSAHHGAALLKWSVSPSIFTTRGWVWPSQLGNSDTDIECVRVCLASSVWKGPL